MLLRSKAVSAGRHPTTLMMCSRARYELPATRHHHMTLSLSQQLSTCITSSPPSPSRIAACGHASASRVKGQLHCPTASNLLSAFHERQLQPWHNAISLTATHFPRSATSYANNLSLHTPTAICTLPRHRAYADHCAKPPTLADHRHLIKLLLLPSAAIVGKNWRTHPYKGLDADACMVHVSDRVHERPELLKSIYLCDIEYKAIVYTFVEVLIAGSNRSAQGLRNFIEWDDQQQQKRKLEAQTLSRRQYLGVQPLKKWTLEDVRLKRLPVNAFSGEHRWSGTYQSAPLTPTAVKIDPDTLMIDDAQDTSVAIASTSQAPVKCNDVVVIKQESVIKCENPDEVGGTMLHGVYSDTDSDWDGFSDGSEWHGIDSEMEWSGSEDES